jgi:hypothetical protein
MATKTSWAFRKYSCPWCDRGFDTAKAMLLHRNTCRQRPVEDRAC